MRILELSRKGKDYDYVEVRLNYADIREINLALYEYCKNSENSKRTSLHRIHRDIAHLFEIFKNGGLDCWSIRMLKELEDKVVESQKDAIIPCTKEDK